MDALLVSTALGLSGRIGLENLHSDLFFTVLVLEAWTGDSDSKSFLLLLLFLLSSTGLGLASGWLGLRLASSLALLSREVWLLLAMAFWW